MALLPQGDSVAALAVPIVNHSGWTRLLQRHVHPDGRVDYAGFKADEAALDEYLALLARAKLDQALIPVQMIGFWINVYNASVIKGVLDHINHEGRFPVIVKDVPGFFDRITYHIGGEALTLNQIEQRLRKFEDPRVHFALVCASRSCPDLRPEAFPEGDEMMAGVPLLLATLHFLAQPKGMQADPAKKTLRLSMIFKWYAKDFGSVIDFVKRYAPPQLRTLPLEQYRIEYLPYDWTLNR